MPTTRIWDLPTRLFHWILAACVLMAVVTAKIGGTAMVWHVRFGLAVLALLVFRLVWGFMGGHWSRFRSFVFTPAATWRWISGRPAPGERLDIGHSPSGALAVFAVLGLLAAQVATGLVADDEIATTGPLAHTVSGAVSTEATAWHTGWGQWLILAMVGLHLAAIAWYTARGRGLLGAMIGGDKALDSPATASADGLGPRVRAAVVAAAATALAVAVARMAPAGF